MRPYGRTPASRVRVARRLDGRQICVPIEERDIAARQNAEHGIHTVVGAP